MSRIARTVACCIGLAVALVTSACGSPAHDSGVTATASAATTALAAWADRTLPSGADLSVDAEATRNDLALAGLDTTVAPDGPATGPDDSYLVSADASGSAARVLSADLTAVPVARFGDQGAAWLVDRLVAQPRAQVAVELAQATARRAAAGAGLLANPDVTVCGACGPVLSSGGLDLRAESLVAVLAAAGPVQVLQIVADPAESRAAQPARSLVIGGTAPGTVRSLVGVTAGDYRPTITAVSTTTTTLTWALTDPITLTGA